MKSGLILFYISDNPLLDEFNEAYDKHSVAADSIKSPFAIVTDSDTYTILKEQILKLRRSNTKAPLRYRGRPILCLDEILVDELLKEMK